MAPNCDGYFCDKHRDPEKHTCEFNFQKDQHAKLRSENPKVYTPATTVHNYPEWLANYMKQHPRNGERSSVFHSVGATVFIYFLLVHGVWGGIAENNAMLICKYGFLGFLLGFLFRWYMDRFLGLHCPSFRPELSRRFSCCNEDK